MPRLQGKLAALAAAVATAGCGLLLDPNPALDAGAGAADGGAFDGGASDGGASDGGARDAAVIDAGGPDGRVPDGRVPDGRVPDGGALASDAGDAMVTDRPRPPGCAEDPDEHVVAWYRMESVVDGLLVDATGSHGGTFVEGPPADTDGPPGCGRALVTGSPLRGVVPPAVAFDLPSGSVDFWVRRPGTLPTGREGCEGIVSRDALGQQRAGHLTIYYDQGGGVTLRLQSLVEGELFVSSDAALPEHVWAHVGINFGPGGVELWIDGVRQLGSTRLACGAHLSAECPDCQRGIRGNEEPWVIGASAAISSAGSDTPVEAHFEGGAIDELRISSSPRDFGAR